jgi:formate dehydrogenase subunit delta
MRPEKLVMMANQIAGFFDAQGDGAPAAIADHLRRFWDPVMRQEIIALARTASHGLKPSVVSAVGLLEAKP